MKKAVLGPVLLFLSFSGCMKVREDLVVLPDGSGRIVLTITLPAASEAAKLTEAELLAGDPDEFQDKVRGLVALSRPRSDRKDGAIRLHMTAYFDDINAVKFMDEGEGDKAKPKQEFSFRREGETFVLEITGNLLADDLPDRGRSDPDLVRQRDDFFKAMYAGFELRQDVRMPGRITAIEGFQSREDRTASYVIGEKDLQKVDDQKKINDARKFKVSCARSEITDAEAAEFRKELEKAKADWVELRKEMKKAAEKRK
jgi:hypothetical protein